MTFSKMTAVCVCSGCGRTIEKDYVFCPWCGRSRVTNEDCEDAVDSAFNCMQDMQNERHYERLEQMKKKLDNLDKELSSLILSTEMHK